MKRGDVGEGEEEMAEDRRPRAIFMAFGTRGDVFPIAVTLNLFRTYFSEIEFDLEP